MQLSIEANIYYQLILGILKILQYETNKLTSRHLFMMLLKENQAGNHIIATLVYKYLKKNCSAFSIFLINSTIKYLKTVIKMNELDITNNIIYEFYN